jgi:large subunit ribosomal protein L31
MKDGIHPTYFQNAKITCGCGATYMTGSTKEKMTVELCAACHPFYTGKQTLIDTARRVEKFTTRVAEKAKKSAVVGKTAKRLARAKKRVEVGPTFDVEETKTGRITKRHIRVSRKPKESTMAKET